MLRKLLLVSVVSLSIAAFAQNGLTSAGGVVGTGPNGGVPLSTPSATFDSPAPTAGISDAGRAGISDNTPISTAVPGGMNNSTVVYTNYPAVVPEISPALAAVSNEAENAENNERGPANDLSASYYSDTISRLPAGGPSLAEVAARYKAIQSAQNIRTYTNSDVPRQKAGRLDNSVLAANTPPPIPQSSASQGAATTPQASQLPGANPQQEQAQTQSAGNATSPQIQQPQSANEATTSSLPATSTLLPLLGLLGIASGGVGMWYRRHRK
jgi:hypothetical protein